MPGEPWWNVPALVAVWLLGWGVTGLLLVLMVRDSVRRRGRWGVNLRRLACPRCDAKLPRLLYPGTLRQAMSGGFTCPECGCVVDKWGRQAIDQNPQGEDHETAS